jgi:hypothetical protein
MKSYEAATTKFLLNLRGVASVNDLPAEDWSLLDAAVNIDDTITDLRDAAARIARDMTRWAEDLVVRRDVPSFPIHNTTELAFRTGKLDAMKGSLYVTLRRLDKTTDPELVAFKAWVEEVTRG